MNRLVVAGLLFAMPVVAVGYTYVAPKSPPEYIIAAVERGSISSVVRASGSVEAVVSVDVSSQLSGRIAEVLVDFNDSVKAGQPLARLDQDIFAARVSETRAAVMVAKANLQLTQAAAERAKTAVDNAWTAQRISEAQSAAVQARQSEAEKELQRQADLARTGVVSVRDLGQARATRNAGAADVRASVEQVELKSEAIAMAEAESRMAEANVHNAEAITQQQQATLDQAELDLARTVVRAPIDGMIIKRDINPGQTVAVSLDAKTLFTIANDLRWMAVHGKIDEADVGRLKVGQVAQFSVDAYPDWTFTGRVLQIRKNPEVVQNVVTYTAIVSAPNPDLLLYPGMTATLRIVVSDTEETLKIPNQALRFRPPEAALGTGAQIDNATGLPSGSATVWVVDRAGHPAPVTIRTGSSDENDTELRAGPLSEGQPLIIGVASSHTRTGPWGIRLGF
jgi:HlyD family secretion protein